jgi:hypothetical protein
MRRRMDYLFCIITVLFLSFGCGKEKANCKTIVITPTKDTNSPTGVYIPNNLEDCFDELKRMLPPDTIRELKQGPENSMNRYHLNLGLWIRNNWGLWRGSRLADYFNHYDIRHPDDMSSIILDSFWRHLNDRPIKFGEQVQFYKEYWNLISIPVNEFRSPLFVRHLCVTRLCSLITFFRCQVSGIRKKLAVIRLIQHRIMELCCKKSHFWNIGPGALTPDTTAKTGSRNLHRKAA